MLGSAPGPARPDFKGKTALVTGAGRGIGRSIALAFAAAGARLFLVDIDQAGGQATEKTIRQQGGQASFYKADVSQESEVAACMAKAGAAGGIDFLINNAAVSAAGAAHVFSEGLAGFDRVLAVNLRGPFLCAKLALPHMQDRQAAIVNISSTRALMSEPRTEAYAAAKGGLTALTHALAISLGPQIRVNSISPGWIDTSGEPEKISRADHGQHPAGRVGQPEDIAAACLWLCSPAASFITGVDLVIDGGMTKKMIYL